MSPNTKWKQIHFCSIISLALIGAMLDTFIPSPAYSSESTPQSLASSVQKNSGCLSCHSDITQDSNHSFSCDKCHNGAPEQATKEEAHKGLLAKPAHPESMAKTCGNCHQKQVTGCQSSLHFTLKNAVTLVREHFGATSGPDSLIDIPIADPLRDPLSLVDDMLRRKCLRCHLYSEGDDYALTSRGTGCAACHMEFVEGKPKSHAIRKTPSDTQCLSCHYANHVGFDYYGRFEHDLHDGYRTPQVTRNQFDRPYGVEYHDLAPDIHQQKGLSCVDCHDGPQLMSTRQSSNCSSCHDPKSQNSTPPPDTVTLKNGKAVLTTKSTGKQHQIPLLSNPAHQLYGDSVACQVCHAQWSFNDDTTHLLLSQTDDYDNWYSLTVQSDSRTERFLDHNLFYDVEELPPWMSDTITGEKRFGVWYQGYTKRRWEDILVGRDTDGMIKVFRPILDLRLSALDDDENIRFDNLTGHGNGLLPYTPHTTGPAGIFYKQRFLKLLKK